MSTRRRRSAWSSDEQMETCDTYCLVPEDVDIAGVLDRLFLFEGVVYHDGETDHRIRDGSEAASAFSRLMRDGEFIRFHVSSVARTQGGWLYRLSDGSAVIGLSGSVYAPGQAIRQALEQAMPGCRCCVFGDQPPPMTKTEFIRAVERKT